MSFEEEKDTIDVITTTELNNSSIVNEGSALSAMSRKNDDKEHISKNTTKYRDSERSLSLFTENNSRNIDPGSDIHPRININESDDEIQLFGKSNQNKMDAEKDTEKESTLPLERELSDKDVQMSQLYQQEKPEIQLLSLAACINTDSLDENEYRCNSNKEKSILSKEDEFDPHLKHSSSKGTKAKKLRRSKTARDASKENKNIKIKKYSSLDSHEDHATIVDNTLLHENNEFENRLFKAAPSENTLDFNKSFPAEGSNCHCSWSNGEEHGSSNYNSTSNDNFTEVESIISKKSRNIVQNLEKPEKDIELNANKSPKILRSCESDLLSKMEKTKNIKNESMDILNSENKVEDYSKLNNERPMAFSQTPDITNSSTCVKTLSALKESAQKNVITKPYYRVGLSKKAKIESLHSYLKR